MPVLKNKTQGRYVNVCKDILENKSLKLRDRGMLVTLLSFPDNWDFSIAGLAKILPDGKSSIAASLERLIQMGYLTKEQERTEMGKFGMNVIEVHEIPIAPLSEKPLAENQVTDKSVTVKPVPEKRSQLSNKELSNKQVINIKSDTLPEHDYQELVAKFGKSQVDYQIEKIRERHYKGCLNKDTLERWCTEYQKNVRTSKKRNAFHNFPQREYDWNELEGKLLNRSLSEAEGGSEDVC